MLESDNFKVFQDLIVLPSGKVFRLGTFKRCGQTVSTWGYCRVRSHGKYYSVHRLVAQLFLDPIPGKTQVDHIDRNKLNNSVENLRYCTALENCRNRTSNKKILCVEDEKEFDYLVDAASYYSVNKGRITESCQFGKAVQGKHFIYC